MLTHMDRTVDRAQTLLDDLGTSGLQHIGFKDVGVDRLMIRSIAQTIRALGAVSYLEIVSLAPDDAIKATEIAIEAGVDRILGGAGVPRMLAAVAGSKTEIYPFAGRPAGHPTILRGTARQVQDDCRNFREAGCPGVDLLAYRASDADPLELTRAARHGLGEDGWLICAGGVASPAHVRALAAAGANAFTVGSAVFDCNFIAGANSVPEQIEGILALCADLKTGTASSAMVAAS